LTSIPAQKAGGLPVTTKARQALASEARETASESALTTERSIALTGGRLSERIQISPCSVMEIGEGTPMSKKA